MRFYKLKLIFFILVAVSVSFLNFVAPVSACGGFAVFPPVGTLHLTEDDTNVMVVYDGRTETFIMEPSYKGNAAEFGIVVPFPSRPTLKNVPNELFSQLEELTYIPPPYITGDLNVSLGFGDTKSKNIGVHIIEQKKVGDYNTTILTADSTQSLIRWLKDHSYQYKPTDEANFNYYIQKGGYYFVALKVNMGKVKTDGEGMIQEKLKPISFKFNTANPVIPLRIEAGSMDHMMFNLYILSTIPYYVPGSDVLFSRNLVEYDMEQAASLLAYDGVNQWLIRQTIEFDPRRVQEDLILTTGNESLRVYNNSSTIKVNIAQLPVRSGIIPGSSANELTIDSSASQPRTPIRLLLKYRIIMLLIIIILGIITLGMFYFLRNNVYQNSILKLKKIVLSLVAAIFSNFLWFIFYKFTINPFSFTDEWIPTVFQTPFMIFISFIALLPRVFQLLINICIILICLTPDFIIGRKFGKRWFFITIFLQIFMIFIIMLFMSPFFDKWTVYFYIFKLIFSH